MTPEQTKRAAEVMLAYAEGKPVELFYKSGRTTPDWQDATKNIENYGWDWNSYDYRLKPQPKEIWANEYDSVTIVHQRKEDAEHAGSSCLTPNRTAVKYVEATEQVRSECGPKWEPIETAPKCGTIWARRDSGMAALTRWATPNWERFMPEDKQWSIWRPTLWLKEE